MDCFIETAFIFAGAMEELKILEIVPGVVIGKDSVMDDPGFLRDLAPTHIATFAERILSPGSWGKLSEGIAKLTGMVPFLLPWHCDSCFSREFE